PPRAGTVVTIHDTTPLAGADLTQPAIAAKAGAIRRLLRSSALIHVPAQGIADELIAEHGAEADRVVVVPHGLRPAPSVVPHEGVPSYERYLITVGRTERRKRVPTIVEMLDDLPDDVALVIAGPIGDDENRLASAVRKLGDPNRVVRVTAASDATRDSLIAGSAGLVLASEYEGFGFTPLEAIQLNVPVAATAVGALPDLIGDGFDLVAPRSPDLSAALAAATLRVLDSAVPATVHRRIDALRWADTAEAMVELYRRATLT
ncbi:MAG: glycosyltransferase, partial [Acidimicrobiales bacterium]|nr:glycosyltransferase [Acidimicrobiales bacterium]